jgi:hypothetical protein
LVCALGRAEILIEDSTLLSGCIKSSVMKWRKDTTPLIARSIPQRWYFWHRRVTV